jgi:hypothetical protein
VEWVLTMQVQSPKNSVEQQLEGDGKKGRGPTHLKNGSVVARRAEGGAERKSEARGIEMGIVTTWACASACGNYWSASWEWVE